MEISKLSDRGLKSMYDAITKALAEDDDAERPSEKKFGVREYPDWRTWGDALEAEIQKRRLDYAPIPW